MTDRYCAKCGKLLQGGGTTAVIDNKVMPVHASCMSDAKVTQEELNEITHRLMSRHSPVLKSVRFNALGRKQ